MVGLPRELHFDNIYAVKPDLLFYTKLSKRVTCLKYTCQEEGPDGERFTLSSGSSGNSTRQKIKSEH